MSTDVTSLLLGIVQVLPWESKMISAWQQASYNIFELGLALSEVYIYTKGPKTV